MTAPSTSPVSPSLTSNTALASISIDLPLPHQMEWWQEISHTLKTRKAVVTPKPAYHSNHNFCSSTQNLPTRAARLKGSVMSSYLQPNLAQQAPGSGPVAAASYDHAASRAEWNRFRPLIKRLYVDEEKTLKEVMAIMERDYGHRAR